MDSWDPRWDAVEAECTRVAYEAAKAVLRTARRRRRRGAPTAGGDMAWRRDVVDGVVWARAPATRPPYREPGPRGAATAEESKDWVPILYHDWMSADDAARKAIAAGNTCTDDGTPHSMWHLIRDEHEAFGNARQMLFRALNGVLKAQSIESQYALRKRYYEIMVEDAFGDTPEPEPEPYDNEDHLHCAYIVPG
jgi:hypothetical protein